MDFLKQYHFVIYPADGLSLEVLLDTINRRFGHDAMKIKDQRIVGGPFVWNDWVEDMQRISRQHPNTRLVSERVGVDVGEYDRGVFLDGKIDIVAGQITFPDQEILENVNAGPLK